MKSYVLAVVAAFAFVFIATAAAFANGHAERAFGHRQGRGGHAAKLTSRVPLVAPQARPGLEALRKATHASKPKPVQKPPRGQKPTQKRKPTRKPTSRRKPSQRVALQPRHGTTSIYEQTTKPWILGQQGCSAARRHETGVVVLDFGQPAFAYRGYGTILFSGRFAPNHRITIAMLGYARGYVSCLGRSSSASITLARGTSNYQPSVPSTYEAGVRWARATNALGRILRRQGLAGHVEAAAADDAEPAWDPHFRKTRDFFHGFRASVHGHDLYDYGSLDGGVGSIWSARQAWFVAGGAHTQAMPEIYYPALAGQWAQLARISRRRFHRPLRFAGVMTQGTSSCACGLRPKAAYRVLAHALASAGVSSVPLPRSGTTIVG